MQAILQGLRIVEGSAFIAAPSCGMTLAQLGADVIRFDQIGGGIDYRRWPVTNTNQSIYWAEMNKGKRSIAVDLKNPRARELVAALISADGDDGGIFSTNLPARGWLDYEALKKNRSDLIQLEIVGDRHGGIALDYTVNAQVGFPSITGPADDNRPVNHVLPAWDLCAGLLAAISILSAERHRRLKNEGQQIKLPLADVALAAMGHLGYIGELMINDEERARHGNYLYGAFGRDFETSDNERLMVIALSHKQWRGLLDATKLEGQMNELAATVGADLDAEAERFVHKEAIADIFDTWISKQTFKSVQSCFDDNGVCWGRYQTARELVESDPDCSVDNPLFDMIKQPDIGEYLVPSQPMNFGAIEKMPPQPAPRVGEHSEAILADVVGLSTAEIGKLHDEGVIYCAS
ncbi:MAG: CoA transferase [Pseudomonadota bacterium]